MQQLHVDLPSIHEIHIHLINSIQNAIHKVSLCFSYIEFFLSIYIIFHVTALFQRYIVPVIFYCGPQLLRGLL